MAWTTPTTVNAGDAILASLWNEQVRDNSAAIRDAQVNVQSATKTDVFTTTSASYTDVTGLSVTITPSSASSNVLVIVSLSMTNITSAYNVRAAILRDSTQIAGGTAAGSRPSASFFQAPSGQRAGNPLSMTHLDSPNTTSATTYKVQVATEASAGAGVAINRSDGADTNSIVLPRLASSITVIEVPV